MILNQANRSWKKKNRVSDHRKFNLRLLAEKYRIWYARRSSFVVSSISRKRLIGSDLCRFLKDHNILLFFRLDVFVCRFHVNLHQTFKTVHQ